MAVYHPKTGNWHIRPSNGDDPYIIQWGYKVTRPAVADYDGDGVDDIAVYDPDIGRWFVLESSTGLGRTFSF